MRIRCTHCLALVVFGMLAGLSLLCTNPAQPEPIAPIIHGMRDTIVSVNDSVTVWVRYEGDPTVTPRYVWWVDGDSVAADTTSVPAVVLFWGLSDTGTHTIKARAYGEGGTPSEPTLVRVDVHLYAPYVPPVADTSIPVNDTLAFVPAGLDTNGEIHEYVLTIDDDSAARYPGDADTIPLVWGVDDTGTHTVRITAMDDDSIVSADQIFAVEVRLCPPSVTIPSDMSVAIYDTLLLRATGADTNGEVTTFVWALDGATFADTTTTDSIARVWTRDDTGTHRIRVFGVDDDGVESNVDSCTVTVVLGAPRVSAMSDTSVWIRDTVDLRAEGSDSNGAVAAFVWTMDGAGDADTTDSGLVRLAWSIADTGAHTIRVVSIDDDTVASEPDSFSVTVSAGIPRVDGMDDTLVAINDSVYLHAAGTDTNGPVVAYLWALDGTTFADTTVVGTLMTVWARHDTGTHRVLVAVVDDDALVSPTDTIEVAVAPFAPTVQAADDTTVAVYDTVVLRAQGSDSNGLVAYYVWALDGVTFADTTSAGTLSVAWPPADTGSHVVQVMAVDDDTVASRPDSLTVHVELLAPTIVPVQDTFVGGADTVQVTVQARDTNGTVEKYYWDYGGDGWDDSTDAPSLSVWYAGAAAQTMVAGARDDDGTIASDTFVIHFNLPPSSVSLRSPVDTASFWGTDSLAYGTVAFTLGAVDPNGMLDTMTFRFSIGTDPDSLEQVHSGRDSLFTVDSLDSGVYYWRATAEDLFGDTCSGTDTLIVAVETRVCFLGHSIAAGLAGDDVHGGYRRGVLDSMRAHANRYEIVKPVGTLLTGMMLPVEDDSCIAQNSLGSYDVYAYFVTSYRINADYWIIMQGVNGDYNYWYEQRYTSRLVDSVHYRNPLSETYILNGLPIPDTLTAEQPTDSNRAAFNEFLQGMVAVRQSLGWKLHMVDAFNVMAADSVFNDPLFSDYLHPNQLGYDRLAEEIWHVIDTH